MQASNKSSVKKTESGRLEKTALKVVVLKICQKGENYLKKKKKKKLWIVY